MPSIHLRGVSYAHSAAVPVFAGLDLDLSSPPSGPRWVGVVGANGAGKTTLLELVAGRRHPDAGTVHVPATGPVVLVAQSVGTCPSAVTTFAQTWDGAALRLRRRLALDPDDLAPEVGRGWDGLTPGQRKRWQIGAALASEPEVLLLDEPTNHLDRDGRSLLLDALRLHRGLGLVVSHDRALLDTLTDQTLRLAGGRTQLYSSRYSQARARWESDAETRRRDHDRARQEARRQRRILADVRRDRHSAEAGARRSRREAGHDRPDAREAGRRFAQAKAEAALAARVRQLRARSARADAELASVVVDRDHRDAVVFEHEPSGRDVVAALTGDVPSPGGPWLRDVDVVVAAGDRVRIDGDNGAGKTTLLRALAAAARQAGVATAELPQVLCDPLAEITRVTRLDPDLRGRVLGIAAHLGIDPDRVLVTDAPSPGEARKLALARLLATPAAVLVLDEPTNHLDIGAIERLEEALLDWSGALLLVTHDDRLGDAVTDVVWHVADRLVAVGRPSGPV